MLLGEPPLSAWDLNFRLLGIPVRIHPFFWLVAVVLVGQQLMEARNVQQILSILLPWTAALTVGILVHELGHALAMRRYGRSPQITLYGLGGLTSSGHQGLYYSRGFSTAGQIFISAAGPLAGFLLAGVVVLLCTLLGFAVVFGVGSAYGLSIAVAPMASPWLWWFVSDLLFVCVFWGLINLLPIYPLDGGQIAREVLVALNPRQGIRRSLVLSVVAAAGLAVVGLLLWGDWFVALFFGYLAYSSYTTLENYSG